MGLQQEKPGQASGNTTFRSPAGSGMPRRQGRRLQQAASPAPPGEQLRALPEFLLPPLPPQASSLASAILIGLGGLALGVGPH